MKNNCSHFFWLFYGVLFNCLCIFTILRTVMKKITVLTFFGYFMGNNKKSENSYKKPTVLTFFGYISPFIPYWEQWEQLFSNKNQKNSKNAFLKVTKWLQKMQKTVFFRLLQEIHCSHLSHLLNFSRKIAGNKWAQLFFFNCSHLYSLALCAK